MYPAHKDLRVLTILMILCLVIAALSGCGPAANNGSTDPPPEPEPSPSPIPLQPDAVEILSVKRQDTSTLITLQIGMAMEGNLYIGQMAFSNGFQQELLCRTSKDDDKQLECAGGWVPENQEAELVIIEFPSLRANPLFSGTSIEVDLYLEIVGYIREDLIALIQTMSPEDQELLELLLGLPQAFWCETWSDNGGVPDSLDDDCAIYDWCEKWALFGYQDPFEYLPGGGFVDSYDQARGWCTTVFPDWDWEAFRDAGLEFGYWGFVDATYTVRQDQCFLYNGPFNENYYNSKFEIPFLPGSESSCIFFEEDQMAVNDALDEIYQEWVNSGQDDSAAINLYYEMVGNGTLTEVGSITGDCSIENIEGNKNYMDEYYCKYVTYSDDPLSYFWSDQNCMWGENLDVPIAIDPYNTDYEPGPWYSYYNRCILDNGWEDYFPVYFSEDHDYPYQLTTGSWERLFHYLNENLLSFDNSIETQYCEYFMESVFLCFEEAPQAPPNWLDFVSATVPDCEETPELIWCQEVPSDQGADQTIRACGDEIGWSSPEMGITGPLVSLDRKLNNYATHSILEAYALVRDYIRTEEFSACEEYYQVQNIGYYNRTGITLSEAFQRRLFQPTWSSDTVIIDLSNLEPVSTDQHCSIFEPMDIGHYLYSDPGFKNSIYVTFPFGGKVPGVDYAVTDDPIPFDYTATLGDVSPISCSGDAAGELQCSWLELDGSFFGTNKALSLYVSGCDDPIYTADVKIPSIQEDRCAAFDDIPMTLHLVNASPRYLELAVEMTGGVPGLEVEYDNLPAGYRGFIFSYETNEYFYSDCGLNSIRPNRAYCIFDPPAELMNSTLQFGLQYEYCTIPVFSQDLVFSNQNVTSGGGNDGGTCVQPPPPNPLCVGTCCYEWVPSQCSYVCKPYN